MFKEFLNIWKKKNLSIETLEESVRMLRMDREMFIESVRSLRRCDDGKFNIDVYAKDKEINKAERDIRKKVITHITLFTEHSEITAGLTLVSIVIDIERIGDYTKNIADLALQHPKRLHGGCFEEELSEIEKKVEQFFDITIKAFPESNMDLAREVVNQYKSVSHRCDGMIGTLIKGEGNFNVSDAVTLALYFRFLKRTSAHLHNICTSIVNPFHRIGFSEKHRNNL
jgi:phosphate uptake regulator